MSNWMLFSDQALAEALGWTVLHSLWQGLLLVLLLRGSYQLWPQSSATQRYRLAYGTLMLQLVLAIFTFSLLYEFIPEQPLAEDQWPPLVVAPMPEFVVVEAPLTVWQQLQLFIEPSLPLIALVWWLGMLFFFLKMLLGYYSLHRLRRRYHLEAPASWLVTLAALQEKMKISRQVVVRLSEQVSSPMLLGHIKPMILFPVAMMNQLSVWEVEAILAHELAHLRRFDYLLNVVQLFIEAVFYYHPAIWWLGHEIRALREQSCDDIAVASTGNSLAYAKTLLRVADHRREQELQFSLGLLGQNKRQLLHRVKRILNQPDKQTDMREKFAVMSILLSLALLVSVSTGWSWPSTPNPEAETAAIAPDAAARA